MRIKELDDELGKGIGVYLDGRFFEVRNTTVILTL